MVGTTSDWEDELGRWLKPLWIAWVTKARRRMSNSPWILGAPHSRFSKLILRMRSRTSLPICGRPPERTGFPSPVGGKTRSMPTHNSRGPDDRNGVKYARTATIEPNEQSTVGPTRMQSTWRALP